MKTIDIVKEAQLQVGNWDFEDIVAQTLRNGYTIAKVYYIKMAIETLQTGFYYLSNDKTWQREEPPIIEEIREQHENSHNGKARMNLLYQRRKDSGLCYRCGKVPPVKGKKTCKRCGDIDRERNRRRTRRGAGCA